MHPYYPQDAPRDAGDIFNGGASGSQPQQQMNFQQQLGSLQQVNMEMLENLLMQDSSGQQGQQPQHAHAPATPQAMLEHQVKINQLQQLQQLQQQIFQQQVRSLTILGSCLSGRVGLEGMMECGGAGGSGERLSIVCAQGHDSDM